MKIYLDNNATTKLDQSVLEAMLIEFQGPPLNPSSVHFFGRVGKKLLRNAREKIAKFLHVLPSEIIFTSSGTESMHLLIEGILGNMDQGTILTTRIEHACCNNLLNHLEANGFTISYIDVDQSGAPDPSAIQSKITPDTKLLIFTAVNSETGVKIDLNKIAGLAEKNSIPLVVDGVGLLGKEKFSIPAGVTGMGFSAHKFHGPKGIGFVFAKSSAKLTPLFFGGNQEQKLRAGTENLAGILGLAKAIEKLENQDAITSQIKNLRDLFESNLNKSLTISINGTGKRVCNTSNICFEGICGETLLMYLDQSEIAASLGSACSAGALEPSRVLLGMGYSKKHALSSLRFSLSRFTTEEEIQIATTTLIAIVKKLQSL